MSNLIKYSNFIKRVLPICFQSKNTSRFNLKESLILNLKILIINKQISIFLIRLQTTQKLQQILRRQKQTNLDQFPLNLSILTNINIQKYLTPIGQINPSPLLQTKAINSQNLNLIGILVQIINQEKLLLTQTKKIQLSLLTNNHQNSLKNLHQMNNRNNNILFP